MLCSGCLASTCKVGSKDLKMYLLGYFHVQKDYQCYCFSLNTYLVASNVTFFEHFSFYSSPSFSSNTSWVSIKSRMMISLSTMLFPLLILFVSHLHMCLLLFVHPSLKSMIDDNLVQFHALPLKLLRLLQLHALY